MKPGKRLDFRSEVERLLSEVRTGSMMNEVPLLDTGIKVYIFKVGERTFFSMYNIIDIFQYFGNVEDPMSICEYLKSINCVEKLGELGESFENRDLEVVCSDFITNEVFMAFQKRISDSKQRDEEMKIYFNQMDMEQVPDSVFNLDEYGLDLSSKPRESLENSHSINGLYPFNGQWTDSIMDGILKNIYTSDEHNMGVNNTSKTCLDVNRVSGRGRHVKPSGNLKDRPFVCTYKDCKRAFKRYEHLKRHNLMHTGERPHKCKFPGCSKAFSRSDNLSQHYKIHNVADSMHTKTYESYRYLNKEFN